MRGWDVHAPHGEQHAHLPYRSYRNPYRRPYRRYEEDKDAHVLFSVGVAPDSPECLALVGRLVGRGYPTIDVSEIEMAQVSVWCCVRVCVYSVCGNRVCVCRVCVCVQCVCVYSDCVFSRALVCVRVVLV